MIEIGRERTALLGVRTIASIAGNIAGLLVILWLIRQILPLEIYSAIILTAAFALMYAHGILDTKTLSAGRLRAVSSILWNTTGTSILVIILIYVLGWIAGIQKDSVPASISSQVPNLLIAAIVTGIIAYALGQAAPRFRGPVARGPAIKVTPDSGLDYGKVRLSTKNDSMILPIRAQRGTVGAMVYGDMTATFDTPMGTVTGSIPGPLTTIGIPFRGEKASSDEVTRITGKSLGELKDEADVDTTLPRGEIFGQGFTPSRSSRGERVDLPFIHVRSTAAGEDVQVGPIHVNTGAPMDDDVEVGPFNFNPCDWITSNKDDAEKTWFSRDRGLGKTSRRRGRFASRWLAKSNNGNSYLSASPEGLQARWNGGSSLRLKGDSMKLAVGQDGFVYTPTELETYSPLHTLNVTPTKATLNAGKFALNIIGNKVILRSQDGSKSTESSALAKDLLNLLTETANSQVKSVMKGQPMELDEMLLGTEEVLKKHE